MEIFLQWLDEVEDLVFVIALAWERLRWRCLQTGLLAAVIFGATELSHPWAPVFAWIAASSVTIWLLGVLGVSVSLRSPDRARA